MVPILLVLALLGFDPVPGGSDWYEPAHGIELRTLHFPDAPDAVGSHRDGCREILVVRIDPDFWSMELAGVSQTGESEGRTARAWAKARGYVVAINAGMFDQDYSTHVGWMEMDGHVNSDRMNPYQSVAAFRPHDPEADPRFRIFDLDDPDTSFDRIRERYGFLVQNLRLIKRPGQNRWDEDTERSWIEVALGEDSHGRILFFYTPESFTMYDFNRAILGAGIDVVAAQHLEGGPWIQLYLQIGDLVLDLAAGSPIEPAFGRDNRAALPIPNVLGVLPRR